MTIAQMMAADVIGQVPNSPTQYLLAQGLTLRELMDLTHEDKRKLIAWAQEEMKTGTVEDYPA